MIRSIRSLSILIVIGLLGQALSLVPTREAVVGLLLIIAVMSFFRSKLNDPSYEPVIYAAVIAAIGLLYFDGRAVYVAAAPPKVETHEVRRPDVARARSTRSGKVSLNFDEDYMRQKMEERRKLRQEDPERWRQQMLERTRLLKEASNLGK